MLTTRLEEKISLRLVIELVLATNRAYTINVIDNELRMIKLRLQVRPGTVP